ncbi:T9SS type A sorting domain-containing protein [Flavobacterium sp. 3HN19-14]|uniref:T9SS type A sorting domain-containing protein n=1 Tax=Flavobacterium sp. 3HN19-14 TaxID=3448133 RepID=UPI003EE0E32D
MIIAVSIPINEDEVAISDTIIFDNEVNSSYCFFNNESRSGNRAMEIRNARNVTQDTIIPGKMILFNENTGDTGASGWNTGFLVDETTILDGIGFFYKFFPMNNDVAQAKLEIFNAGGESIGKAIVEISGTHSEYTYAAAPMILTSDEIPVRMTVDFSMTNGIVPATWGSRLVIDDVTTENLFLSNPSFEQNNFTVYPTPANAEINLIKGSNMADGSHAIEIVGVDGRIIRRQNIQLYASDPFKIDVSSLSKGVYFIRMNGSAIKFIKQ